MTRLLICKFFERKAVLSVVFQVPVTSPVSEITLQDQWPVLFSLQFENYARQTFHIGPSTHSLRFVTDGQLPLRQCLHPETCSKNFDLPGYYAYFHDLRKEFRAFYSMPEEPQSIRDMVACILCTLLVGKLLIELFRIVFGHMWGYTVSTGFGFGDLLSEKALNLEYFHETCEVNGSKG